MVVLENHFSLMDQIISLHPQPLPNFRDCKSCAHEEWVEGGRASDSQEWGLDRLIHCPLLVVAG